jgi:hypothetical protein
VTALILGRGKSVEEMAEAVGLSPEGLAALDAQVNEQFGRGDYRIKRLTKPAYPNLIRGTGLEEAQNVNEFWCVELDFGINSGARDYEIYIGERGDKYIVFGVSSGNMNRDAWWERFGC